MKHNYDSLAPRRVGLRFIKHDYVLLPVVQISLIMNVAKVLSSLGQLIIVQLLV